MIPSRSDPSAIGRVAPQVLSKTLTARLKGSEMRWNHRNAEAMMALATLKDGNLWQPYW